MVPHDASKIRKPPFRFRGQRSTVEANDISDPRLSTFEVLGAFSFPVWDVQARIRGDVWPLTQTEVHKAGARAVSEI